MTLDVGRLVLDAPQSEDEGDNLAQGMLGMGGLVRVHPPSEQKPPKHVSLGFIRVHRARQENDDAEDLRDRPGARFLTVPCLDSGEEITVTYNLTTSRIFEYADGMTPSDLSAGERYRISLHPGYVGAKWWCWGGLDDELKDKKLHHTEAGSLGRIMREVSGKAELSEEVKQRDGWVVGEDRAQLRFAIQEEERSCEVEIVP